MVKHYFHGKSGIYKVFLYNNNESVLHYDYSGKTLNMLNSLLTFLSYCKKSNRSLIFVLYIIKVVA